MAIYRPDCFIIVKITIDEPEDTLYKVLAGWWGGYTGSDSWKLNSGIKSYEVNGDTYLFHGYSGSTYSCHKNAERPNMLVAEVYASYNKQAEEYEGTTFEHIDLKDFIKEFKNI